jgi:CRP/FNR family transcriptional regulator
VLADLTDDRLEQFSRLKLVSRYRKHQRIFYEGEPNLGLSILCEGKVKLSRSSEGGKTQILDVTGPCGLLGEKDLFLSERRSVTAEAIEDCVVCFIKREQFLSFIEENPRVALRLIQHLSEQLARAEDRSFAFTSMDVKRRVAELLLNLASRHGRPARDGCVLDVSLSREDLAEMIGATPETVIRVLSAFRKDGVIADAGKRLVLRQPERLRRVAGQPASADRPHAAS